MFSSFVLDSTSKPVSCTCCKQSSNSIIEYRTFEYSGLKFTVCHQCYDNIFNTLDGEPDNQILDIMLNEILN